MAYRFREWLTCPTCAKSDVGVLGHETDVVLECYGCGETAEYTIGEDVPFVNLDAAAVTDVAGTRENE